MRVLFAIPHYVGPASDPRVPVTQSNIWPAGRLLALHSTLSTLHRSFGPHRHACHSTSVPNETMAHGVTHFDVVILTQSGHHVLDYLPFNRSLYDARFFDCPPLHLAFEAKRVFRDRALDYDYFVYVEDDIQIHDREFFHKLAWFESEFGPKALLQPVRYEMSGRGIPVKASIDPDLASASLAPFRRPRQKTELTAAWNGLQQRFRLPANPHAAFHALSARQLRIWMEQPTFAADDVSWIGPMESAASASIGRIFDIYKPVAPDTFFLSIEHFGAGYLARLSGDSTVGDGPTLAIVNEALRELAKRHDGAPPPASDAFLGYGTSVASFLATRIQQGEQRLEYRRIMALEGEKQRLITERDELATEVSYLRALAPGISVLPRLVRKVRRALRNRSLAANFMRVVRYRRPAKPPMPVFGYEEWCRRYDTIDAADRSAMVDECTGWINPPKIAVLMPVYRTPPELLAAAIDSVRNQTYPHWALIIVDDASQSQELDAILTRAAAKDGRIRLGRRPANGGIATATNTALGMAKEEWIALLDHDDLLAPHALYMVAHTIRSHADAEIIYSDYDWIDAGGRRSNPCFKSDFDLDLLLEQNSISHLGAYRTATVRAVGGFRAVCEGAQDIDLALRIAANCRLDQVRHIPHILYHWRRNLTNSTFSERNLSGVTAAAHVAVEDFLRAKSISAQIQASPWPPFLHVRRQLPAMPPHVTIIVLTRDRTDLLQPCIESLLQRTDYPFFDIVIVDNGSVEPETKRYLDGFSGHRQISVAADPGAFNFSRLNNDAARAARGEIVAFLNNDIEVIENGWLGEMVVHALRSEVGAVGAKLLFPDRTIQHAGVVTGIGCASHVFARSTGPGYFGRAVLTHAVSAVTAACLVMRRDVYLSVGGMDEAFRVAFNDVDLCLRLRARGLLIIYTPHAVLIHKESQSRGSDNVPSRATEAHAEVDLLRSRWGKTLNEDPYYNPNLTLANANYDLADPPRRLLPWRMVAAVGRAATPAAEIDA